MTVHVDRALGLDRDSFPMRLWVFLILDFFGTLVRFTPAEAAWHNEHVVLYVHR